MDKRYPVASQPYLWRESPQQRSRRACAAPRHTRRAGTKQPPPPPEAGDRRGTGRPGRPRRARGRPHLFPGEGARHGTGRGRLGGRQTLRSLQAPPQNGGHLWQGLFSLPASNDRLGANPSPVLNYPPGPPGAAAALPSSSAGMRRTTRRDLEQNPPHLKWRPPRLTRLGRPPPLPPTTTTPPQPRCSLQPMQGQAGLAPPRLASLRARSGGRAEHSSLTHGPGLPPPSAAAPQAPRSPPPRSPRARSASPGGTHLCSRRTATAQWGRTKALRAFIPLTSPAGWSPGCTRPATPAGGGRSPPRRPGVPGGRRGAPRRGADQPPRGWRVGRGAARRRGCGTRSTRSGLETGRAPAAGGGVSRSTGARVDAAGWERRDRRGQRFPFVCRLLVPLGSGVPGGAVASLVWKQNHSPQGQFDSGEVSVREVNPVQLKLP